MKVGVLARPVLCQFKLVQIVPVPHTPIEPHRPPDTTVERIFEDALHRREAGRTRNEQDRHFAVTQREVAQRALEIKRITNLHLREHMRCEAAAGDPAHMEFDVAVVMRWVGE